MIILLIIAIIVLSFVAIIHSMNCTNNVTYLVQFMLSTMLIIAGVLLFYPLATILLAIHPSRVLTHFRPEQYGLKYENVQLTTKDNMKLAAWFIPNKNSKSVILACHGYRFDKGDSLDMIAFLAKSHNLLVFDFRYFGQSQGSYTTAGWKEVLDVKAAIDYLKKKGFKKIGAWGYSMGAASLIMSGSPEIKALVADSPYARLDWVLCDLYRPRFLKKPFTFMTRFWSKIIFGEDLKEVSTLNKIGKLKAPVLLIHGEEDQYVSVKHTQALCERANKKHVKLWLVPDTDHCRSYQTCAKDYTKRIDAFFRQHLNA